MDAGARGALARPLGGASARDVEFGGDLEELNGQPTEVSGKCFPCDCLCWCPGKEILPNALHKCQGPLHIMLFCCFLACLAFTGIAISRLSDYAKNWRSKVSEGYILEFLQEIFAVLFMIPCVFYFQKSLWQYNENLPELTKAKQEQQKKLLKGYQDALVDMEKILGDLTMLSSELAGRNFAESQRDFLRFLSFCEEHSQQDGNQQMLHPMKDFCLKWFQVFSEFSLDPIKHPTMLIKAEDLDRCCSVKEVAMYCHFQLKQANLPDFSKVVYARAEKEKVSIEDDRACVSSFAPVGRALRRQTTLESIERTPWLFKPIRRKVYYLPIVSWLVFGCAEYEIAELISDGTWPYLIRFGFGCLVILSREHLLVLLTYLAGCVLFFSEVFRVDHDWPFMILAFIAGLCLFVTLLEFEQVDILQRLEREIFEINRQKDVVAKKREEVSAYWRRIHNVNELWPKRSIPFLELHHEIQQRFKSAIVGGESIHDSQEVFDCMFSVGAVLDTIYNGLGDISHVLGNMQSQETIATTDAFLASMDRIRRDAYRAESLNDFTDILANHQDFGQPPALERGISSFLKPDTQASGTIGSFLNA